MDNASRILTYVVIFLLFQLAGPPSLSNEQLKAVAKYLEIVRTELDTLANVTLSDFSEQQIALSALNFTNIKESSSENHQQLHPAQLEPVIETLWQNDSGNTNASLYMHPNSELTGEVFFNTSVQGIELPLPIFKNEEFPNWKSLSHSVRGSLSLQLFVRPNFEVGTASIVSGTASFLPDEMRDAGPLPLTDIPVRGIYLNSGKFVVSTSSLKFQGSAALPYIIGSEDARQAMLGFLNSTAPDKIDVYAAWQVLEVQKSRALDSAEFVIYGQARLDDSDPVSEEQLRAIEHELESPEGAPLPQIPKLISDVVLWSPDSGLNGVAQNASGIRIEVLLARRHRVLLGLLLIYIALTALMGKASLQLASPSRAGKFSVWTAAFMALMDATMCITQATSSDGTSSQLGMGIALFAFVLTVWFELDLVTRIYSAHSNESALAEYQNQRTADEHGGNADNDNDNEGGGAPAPPRPPADYVSEREISGRVYGRFYLTLFGLFVSALLFSHSRTSRYRFEAIILTLFYSYWIPQIWRSTAKGSQVPLDSILICEIAGLRLLPLAYVCFVKGSVVGNHYQPLLGAVLISWQCTQVGFLIVQSRFGPRFFLPRSWTVEGYDYHRLLSDDLEQQDTTLTTPRTSGQDPTELEFNENIQSYCREVSCAICMETVALPIHRSGPVTPALEGERQKYMITPCRHVFHTECLEQWMESKLQCPVCRSPLPGI